jgi:polynucleotide 5'-kinase involved in rRNA processing
MSAPNLRSPVVSVIGSVNVGKTTFIKYVTGKVFDEGDMTLGIIKGKI